MRWRMLSMALCLAIGALCLTSCGKRQKTAESGGLAERPQQFVDLLAKGDFETAAEGFDAVMTQAMPAQKLQEAWSSLTGQFGAFEKQAGVRTAKEQGFDVAYVTCEFEKGRANIKVVWDSAGEVSGLWFLPPS